MAGNLQGQPNVRKRIRSSRRAFPIIPSRDRLAQSRARVSYSRSDTPLAFTLAALTKEMNKYRIGGIKGGSRILRHRLRLHSELVCRQEGTGLNLLALPSRRSTLVRSL